VEYIRAVHAFTPSTHAAPSTKTIASIRHLHPLVGVDLPPFVNNFHLKIDFVLDRNGFISILTRFPCLSSNDALGTVYELLQDYFVFDDFASGFAIFFEICKHIVCGHILPLVSHLLVAL
jgi:hypothetical protein